MDEEAQAALDQYRAVPDPAAAARGFARIVDESGHD
jgi:hypothetical protein